MRTLRRVLLAIVLLASVFLILLFVLENQETVALIFFGSSVFEFPVSIYIILSLLVGMVFGPLLRFFWGWGRKR